MINQLNEHDNYAVAASLILTVNQLAQNFVALGKAIENANNELKEAIKKEISDLDK